MVVYELGTARRYLDAYGKPRHRTRLQIAALFVMDAMLGGKLLNIGKRW